MKISEALKSIVELKDQMIQKLNDAGVQVDSSNYEKIRDKYLDSFGKDYIIQVYDEINQALSDCPIMVD